MPMKYDTRLTTTLLRETDVEWQPWPTEGTHTVTGELLFTVDFPVPHLKATRTISVLLPASYHESATRYPVLYMHDGQNLFDAAIAYAGTEWQVDETLALLATEGIEAIVVGIDHAGEGRIAEYSPFGSGKGDLYLDWLFGLLKPHIDDHFRTLPQREQTFMAGSSMGGLISLHAMLTRPHLLGGVAALSPSLWVHRFAILDEARRADLAQARIYLDYGTREQSALPMQRILLERGLVEGGQLHFVREEGGLHNEAAWARRLPDALRYLLAQTVGA